MHLVSSLGFFEGRPFIKIPVETKQDPDFEFEKITTVSASRIYWRISTRLVKDETLFFVEDEFRIVLRLARQDWKMAPAISFV